jgi:hypothetical protein
MDLMLDVATFGIFGAKKFSARWQVIEKRAYLHLRPWRFAASAHDLDLAPVDDDFGSCHCVSLASGQTKSRHAGNAWQCFAAKSQCSYSLQIGSRPNLARGMSFERQQRVITIHTAAVIDHSDELDSSATNHCIDFTRSGVDAVFNQLLHY